MVVNGKIRATLILSVMVGWGPPSVCQTYYDLTAAHSQGNIQLTVQRGGWGYLAGMSSEWLPYVDPITNDTVYGCEYPRDSRHWFMEGDLFVGAVVGSDTLVTNTWEWRSYSSDPATLWYVSSSDRNRSDYSPKARSELDLECQFLDTSRWYFNIALIDTIWEYGWHEPLGLVMTQRSMAWSGAYVDDFVLFEFEMRNMGHANLKDVYVGFACAPPLHTFGFGHDEDELTGFLREFSFDDRCPYYEKLNIAYCMDNDGDPVGGEFGHDSKRAAVGLILLGGSEERLRVGYNWIVWDTAWEQDWGPRRWPSNDDPWRSFKPYFAWPGNDRNLYYMMRRSHIAYDQLFAAVNHVGEGWLGPNDLAEQVASGWLYDMHYYIGPFQIDHGERANFTIAVVGGDHVHNDPYAHFDPLQPQAFYDQLDFSELATNARWAQWVYDNPGYDTDSDGYRGEFRICEGDTIWYKGDGVPDFRGNTPPPAPFMRILTEPSKITIRWNGFLCETTKDPFSGLYDFEGYRVYSGLDGRLSSLSILTSYDRENFVRMKYRVLGKGEGEWITDEPPYSLDSLRVVHNDPELDPHRYNRSHPLLEGDSAFFFEAIGANLDGLTSMRGIHKVYPDATDPGIDPTQWTENDVTHDYGQPLPKYYEYEYIHDNLMPTVPYFISVTSLDFGYVGGRSKRPPQESSPLDNLTECYAQTSADSVEAYQLDAYVYPNPYRVDADYHTRGYENRAGRIIPDRARLLHFGNLPNVCKISIFSLDGDLIGTIDHNYPEGGPEAMHDWWNLVSRSGLAVESGLYYWVVESSTRSQIGKFVILK